MMDKIEELCKQILQIIGDNKSNQIPQHILISGKEGAGKSFVLNEIGNVLKDKEYHTTMFLYPYCVILKVEDIIQATSYKGRVALIIDDIDKMFAALSTEELYQLRAYIFRKGAPTLITSCRGLPAGFTDYKAPFYDAFRVFHIPELTSTDIEDLVTPEIYQQIKGIEGVQTTIPLFNGNVSYIKQFAKEVAKNTNFQQALDKVVEFNERYFKAKFATFSIVQQRVLYGLAIIGHAAMSSEMSHVSGVSTSNTSSALFRLEKQGVVCKQGSQKRNSLYAFSDFLFARWIAKRCLT